MEGVVERLAAVRHRIAAAGGDVRGVTVVAVTKGFGADAVAAARAAGIDDIGENWAQPLAEKWDGRPRWHLLGAVQRNKVRALAGRVDLWQAVERLSVGEELARRAPGAAVLVEVNLSGERQRAGCAFADAPALVDGLRRLALDVRGLMGVGPAGDPELSRPGFRALATMARRLGLSELSMGMTDDLEVAVQEGSTMVRVGRALFGPRPGPSDLRR